MKVKHLMVGHWYMSYGGTSTQPMKYRGKYYALPNEYAFESLNNEELLHRYTPSQVAAMREANELECFKYGLNNAAT